MSERPLTPFPLERAAGAAARAVRPAVGGHGATELGPFRSGGCGTLVSISRWLDHRDLQDIGRLKTTITLHHLVLDFLSLA